MRPGKRFFVHCLNLLLVLLLLPSACVPTPTPGPEQALPPVSDPTNTPVPVLTDTPIPASTPSPPPSPVPSLTTTGEAAYTTFLATESDLEGFIQENELRLADGACRTFTAPRLELSNCVIQTHADYNLDTARGYYPGLEPFVDLRDQARLDFPAEWELYAFEDVTGPPKIQLLVEESGYLLSAAVMLPDIDLASGFESAVRGRYDGELESLLSTVIGANLSRLP